MIAANELRLGNWIDNYHSPYDRGQVTAEHFSTVDSDGFISGDGIPLTAEILEKAGFIKNEDAGNWNGKEFIIYNNDLISLGVKDNYIGWYNKSEDDFYSSYYPQFKYLHHLQNFTHALTGEELTINMISETVK